MRLVCIAEIAGAHGIRGMVKLRCFATRPENLLRYRDFCDEAGQHSLVLKRIEEKPGFCLAAFEGITDRTAAEKLKGRKLHIPRDRLPDPPEGEYYLADLAGLLAFFNDGAAAGTVLAVHDFGAGPVLEIARPQAKTFFLPFSDPCVPEVDIARGRIVINPPPEFLE